MIFETQQEKLMFIYRNYAHKMKGLAMRYLGDDTLADDVVQEAFLDIMKKCDDIIIENRQAMPSLIGFIVKCKAVDLIRGRLKVEYMASVTELAGQTDGTEYDLIDSENAVVECIEKLKEGDREVLTAKLIREESYDAIAKALYITEQTARKRYERARKRLAKVLIEEGVIDRG